MAGIYLHIPFCRKACVYCDFHFSTQFHRKGELVDALCAEMELQQSYLDTHDISSVYFGGGTPSVLTNSELEQIFDHLQRHFNILPGAEITLEANPDDLNPEKLKELQQLPINRLSIGIQSFDDDDLRFMNRTHDARQALQCVETARDFGFQNLSIDLIYGLPGRDEAHWEEQLAQAIALRVPHISAYALTVEKETVLENWIRKGKIAPLDEDMASRDFNLLHDRLQEAGYLHYEISNFALPGYKAVHNSSYWRGEPYLGLGPSAHSFNGDSRQWNVSNNQLYISSITDGEMAIEKETLSPADRFNETVMTSLRQAEGIDLDRIDSEFGVEFSYFLQRESKPLLEKGQLVEQDRHLFIPAHQRFYSDGIASSLFYI